MHICERVYDLSRSNIVYGNVEGICRITGKKSTGLLFDKWVKKTFNDYAFLKPGTIISNEALFCFDEQSKYLQKKTGREKLQRFRTYSHVVYKDIWHCFTKADKKQIFELICDGAEVVSLNDTGQKHILFKHRPGFWQLDDLFVSPDVDTFKYIHTLMCDMLRLGFSQAEVIGGEYKLKRIDLAGLSTWKDLEDEIKKHRGSGLFNFAAWMLFISDEDKGKVQQMYNSKKETNKEKEKGQIDLWS